MQSNIASAFQVQPEHIPRGAIIGQKFRVDGVIAEGGMGVVYKGWHLILEHPIAIKVMRPEYANHTEAVERFLNEARASAQLHGIHMLHVLDIGRIENGPPFMILEYLEGQDLRSVLSTGGPLPLSRAVKYILQACDAIAEAHTCGIVHRDLKPENLFITSPLSGPEILKVIDFGISKRLDSSGRSITIENQSLGSPQYMAPEQMSTPKEVDWRADIWSLGIVLFELLTNSIPFPGETFQVICVRVMRDEPVSLGSLRPDLPPIVERIVARCLCKAPEDRFSSTSELARALEPFAAHDDDLLCQSVSRSKETQGNKLHETSNWEDQRPGSESGASVIANASSMHESIDTNPRIPMRPRRHLAVGATVILVALTVVERSDTKTLRQVTRAAQATIHAVSDAYSKAAGLIEFEVNKALGSGAPVVPSAALSSSPREFILLAPRLPPRPTTNATVTSSEASTIHTASPGVKYTAPLASSIQAKAARVSHQQSRTPAASEKSLQDGNASYDPGI